MIALPLYCAMSRNAVFILQTPGASYRWPDPAWSPSHCFPECTATHQSCNFEVLEEALRDCAEFGDYGVEMGRSKRGGRAPPAKPTPSLSPPRPKLVQRSEHYASADTDRRGGQEPLTWWHLSRAADYESGGRKFDSGHAKPRRFCA